VAHPLAIAASVRALLQPNLHGTCRSCLICLDFGFVCHADSLASCNLMPSFERVPRSLSTMLIINWIIEILFDTVCGWVGHYFVKAVTLGKVDLEWGDSSESIVTESIGAAVLIGLLLLISLLIGRA